MSSQPPVSDLSQTPALGVEIVHKSFGELEVLRGIDLSLAEHDVVCLIGASGSGKSAIDSADRGPVSSVI